MEKESLRAGDVTTVENLSFTCGRLGGNALITLTRVTCTHEDKSDDHLLSTRFSGCASKFACGLFVGDPRGAYKATEDLATGCDAQKMLNQHNDIYR